MPLYDSAYELNKAWYFCMADHTPSHLGLHRIFARPDMLRWMAMTIFRLGELEDLARIRVL